MSRKEFLLSDISSSSITLPDNRQLGYAEYGASNGVAVICLHGLPGSRVDFARFDKPAKTVGARIISVDRPGIGLSSPDPRATMLSIAADIEYLTDTLGLQCYAVLGGSAGGPYALACAYALPKHKLKVVAVVCSPGKLGWGIWFLCQCITWTPSSILSWYWQRDPGAQMQLDLEQHFALLRSHALKSNIHEREDGPFTTDESVRIWLTSSRETFKLGVDPVVQDTHRLASDWGFRIEDIRLPTKLWYGAFDEIAPPSQGEAYANQLGRDVELEIMDETHGSMFANQSRCIITEIVKCLESESNISS